MQISKKEFGVIDNKAISLYTLINNNNIEMHITNYGCIVTSLKVPDKQGKVKDIVLGFNNLQDYLADNPYFGCVVGRYGNRIANGKFSINDNEYKLAQNNGANNLHGGIKGFNKKVWHANETKNDNYIGVEFNYVSKDGEEGFPGNLSATVTYLLNNNNEFKINYKATTDKVTICNLTHHSYFNLSGESSGTILDHRIMINARKYTPVNSNLITTGELVDVTGTPFDFRTQTAIGNHINDDNPQLKYAGGYDHNWVIDKPEGSKELIDAVTVSDPKSGRNMDVLTTEPGIQFYSGNFLDGSLTGKSGLKYQFRSGLCLEPQHYPDSPNKPNFPSTILKPGQLYNTTTIYKFYC